MSSADLRTDVAAVRAEYDAQAEEFALLDELLKARHQAAADPALDRLAGVVADKDIKGEIRRCRRLGPRRLRGCANER